MFVLLPDPASATILMLFTPQNKRGGQRFAPTPTNNHQQSLLQAVLNCVTYLTVTLPFMFIARCGVQKKSYVPAGTPAKEIT